MLAIVDTDPDVLQGKPGDGTIFQNALNTLFHRGDKLRGNDPAHDLVDEFKAHATGKRFNLKKHFTELACTAGLFLMTAVTLRGFADRLPVRNRRRARAHLKTVLLRHPLDRDAQMQFAGASQHRFVCHRVPLNSKTGV